MHIYSVKTEQNIYIVQAHELRKVHNLVRKEEGKKYNGFDFLRLGCNKSTDEKIINVIEL